MDCCDPNGLDRMFAGRLVQQELSAYRRHGLNGRQRQIVAQLEPVSPGASVLDIGCGLGALGTALLTRGAGLGAFVDVSSAYLAAAREVAAGAGVGERATFYRGDFATSRHPYPQADVVVLDRVVCCYPDAAALLTRAARHSRQTLVFTYPRPLWFVRVFRALCALGMRLTGRAYRFFLHDPERLMRAATSAGHRVITTHPVGAWQVVQLSRSG